MPATKQPDWKFITNLGDRTPIDHGGLFIYTDETGVYPPEMERLERDSDADDSAFTIHRVILEPCTFIGGVLSDNKFHPGMPAWFAGDLDSIASFIGADIDELRADFGSAEVVKRANAWRAVFDYHGWDNGDSYPLHLSLAEVEARYTDGELG